MLFRSSSAFVESTIKQVVSKRMVKKQQMRWSQRGAHLLLQIRTRVLNEDLAGDFRRWYPAFMPMSEPQDLARMNSHGLSRSPARRTSSRKNNLSSSTRDGEPV